MHPEFTWFFILLVLLWVGWYVTGGPTRIETNRKNPFLEAPAPINSGNIYSIDDLKNR